MRKTGHLFADRVAPKVLPVQLRSLFVFRGDFAVIESPEMIEKLRNSIGVARQLNRQNFGAVGPHLAAFHRIVVEQNETIQSKTQLLRYGFQVFRLGPPIDSRNKKLVAPQEHFRVAVENRLNILFVILAAQAEDHSRVLLFSHEFLQRSSRRVDLHAERAIFSARSIPERIVTIDRDDFVRNLLQRV